MVEMTPGPGAINPENFLRQIFLLRLKNIFVVPDPEVGAVGDTGVILG